MCRKNVPAESMQRMDNGKNACPVCAEIIFNEIERENNTKRKKHEKIENASQGF